MIKLFLVGCSCTKFLGIGGTKAEALAQGGDHLFSFHLDSPDDEGDTRTLTIYESSYTEPIRFVVRDGEYEPI